MAIRALISCFCGAGGAEGIGHHFAMRPRYPPKPRRTKAAATGPTEEEKKVGVFTVTGMTCAACAGSVEKVLKGLPGIHAATVDVLGRRAQVVFYPSFVSVEKIRQTIEGVGFGAKLIDKQLKEKS